MKPALLLCLALTGCGTYPLGTVYGGVTPRQREVDMMVCKDQAHTQVDTNARQAVGFLAGVTLVGAPIAIHAEREAVKGAFAECMRGRGYEVVPST